MPIQKACVALVFIATLAIFGMSGCCKIVPFLSRCKTPSAITIVSWSTSPESNGSRPVECRAFLLIDSLRFGQVPIQNLFRETADGIQADLGLGDDVLVSSPKIRMSNNDSGVINLEYPADLDLEKTPDLYLAIAVNFWKPGSKPKSVVRLGRGRPPYRLRLNVGEKSMTLETVR